VKQKAASRQPDLFDVYDSQMSPILAQKEQLAAGSPAPSTGELFKRWGCSLPMTAALWGVRIPKARGAII
jgi:hypothetical protein